MSNIETFCTTFNPKVQFDDSVFSSCRNEMKKGLVLSSKRIFSKNVKCSQRAFKLLLRTYEIGFIDSYFRMWKINCLIESLCQLGGKVSTE